MIPQDFAFEFSERVYLLLFLPLFLLVFTWLFYARKKKLQYFSVNKQIVPQENWIYWSRVSAVCLAWLFATLAFMQPRGNAHYPQGSVVLKESPAILRLKAHEVFFIIDTSASMSIKDTRGGKTRLEQAQEIADETIALLEGESVALYAFTSSLSKLSPLTTDYFFVRLMLRNMQINEGGIPGTDFFASLSHLPETSPEKLKTIILLSDGGDTLLEALPRDKQQTRLQAIKAIFKNQQNLHIYSVGIGTNQEEPVPGIKFRGHPVQSALDDRVLRTLATQGSYYKADDASAIQISRDIISRMRSERALFDEHVIIRAESKELLYDIYFQIPLAIAILFLSYALLFPSTFRLKRALSLLLFLLPLQGYTQNLQQAAIYAEADDPKAALGIYAQLLEETPEPWKKSILRYNMGVTLLQDHSWQKAIETFQSIEIDDNPLLALYLKRNLAIARFSYALSVEPYDTQTYLQQIYQLRDSLHQISLAEQASCALQQLEGDSKCYSDKELTRFRNEIKEALSKSLEAYRVFHKSHLNVQEGLYELLYSLSVLRDNTLFLMQPLLPSSYHAQFTRENRSWAQLWTNMQHQIGADHQELFDKSYKNYKASLEAFEQGSFAASLHLTQQSEQTLDQLLKLVWGGDLPQDILQNLIAMYQQIAVRDILSEELLLKLQDRQKHIATLTSSDLKEPLQKALSFLNLSISSLQQSTPLVARLYFEAAYFIILDLMPDEILSPKDSLQKAIERQEHALQLNRIRQQSQKMPQKALSLISNAQQGVLHQAQSFLSSVFKAQEAGFKKGFCERKPWDVYLPKFNLGYFSASQAFEKMVDDPMQAIVNQEETLTHWKQLKHDMDNPPKREEEKRHQEMAHILQRLQEMSQDDQIQKNTTIKQQVERPW